MWFDTRKDHFLSTLCFVSSENDRGSPRHKGAHRRTETGNLLFFIGRLSACVLMTTPVVLPAPVPPTRTHLLSVCTFQLFGVFVKDETIGRGHFERRSPTTVNLDDLGLFLYLADWRCSLIGLFKRDGSENKTQLNFDPACRLASRPTRLLLFA